MSQGDYNQNKDFANPNIFQGYAPIQHNPPAIEPAPAAMCPEVETRQDVPAGVGLKHNLNNTWTMWYLEDDRTKTWEDMLNEIASFETVEDFWSIYNHIKPPSDLKLGSDYSIFRKGIRPMWEDNANKQGGRWVIHLTKNWKSKLDDMWLEAVLCLIGEAFDHSNEVCGIVVNIRGRINKISVWTANAQNEEAIIEIGNKLRQYLHLDRITLHYQLHMDSIIKQSSSVNSIYTL